MTLPIESRITILFADIHNSTGLYEQCGDQLARELVAQCLLALSDIAAENRGTLVKTIGDEIMCSFGAPELAIRAAHCMNEATEGLVAFREHHLPPPEIRIGIHTGPVVRDEADLFGDAVNVAARVVALAKPRQVLVTGDAIELLPEEFPSQARLVDITPLRGRHQELRIYEVLAEVSGITILEYTPPLAGAASPRLQVECGDRTRLIDSANPTLTIGRQSGNDLVIDDSVVSRFHARLEFRRGRAFLVDASTNGTFLFYPERQPMLVRREEAPLVGDGFLCLGCSDPAQARAVIRFRWLESAP